jgi:succinate dehydrogenase hydrophobic anchor subunit
MPGGIEMSSASRHALDIANVFRARNRITCIALLLYIILHVVYATAELNFEVPSVEGIAGKGRGSKSTGAGASMRFQ